MMKENDTTCEPQIAALYHNVYAHEDCETAKAALQRICWRIVENAPDLKRVLYLDTEHRRINGKLDAEMTKLNAWMLAELLPFVSEMTLLTGGKAINESPRNDVPADWKGDSSHTPVALTPGQVKEGVMREKAEREKAERESEEMVASMFAFATWFSAACRTWAKTRGLSERTAREKIVSKIVTRNSGHSKLVSALRMIGVLPPNKVDAVKITTRLTPAEMGIPQDCHLFVSTALSMGVGTEIKNGINRGLVEAALGTVVPEQGTPPHR
jgi:hypothetical protein